MQGSPLAPGMRMYLAYMLLFLAMVLPGTVSGYRPPSPEEQFTERWKTFDETLQEQVLGPAGFRRRIELPFSSLRPFKGRLSMPADKGAMAEVLVLSEHEGRAVLLVTPGNSLAGPGMLSEEFRQFLEKCSGDHSWLVSLPENNWTAIDLNPYCTMAYDENGIVIDLYWTKSSSRPLIDISTNGFQCVAHRLYSWDGHVYRQVADKCTGSRPNERYSLESAMRQVFPPGKEPRGESGTLRPWSSE